MIDASHSAALSRLNAIVPHAGYNYATQRNYDRPGHTNVSTLSPYIRHRILTEQVGFAAQDIQIVDADTLDMNLPYAEKHFLETQ